MLDFPCKQLTLLNKSRMFCLLSIIYSHGSHQTNNISRQLLTFLTASSLSFVFINLLPFLICHFPNWNTFSFQYILYFWNWFSRPPSPHCVLNGVLREHFLGIKMQHFNKFLSSLFKILLVFEVPYQPWVKGMPGKS